MIDLNRGTTRDGLAGQLIGMYTAVCFDCRDYRTVSASSKAGAALALRNAGWHVAHNMWRCDGCHMRQQGYRELRRRDKARERMSK